MVLSYFIAHAAIPVPFGMRAEVTTDNTSIRVSWQWSRQGVLDLVRVNYQPEGGSEMMYTLGNTTVTSATLSNLQCNTKYTIRVHASGGLHNLRSLLRMVSLPARGTFTLYNLSYSNCICFTVSPQSLPLPLRSLLRS